MLDDRETWLKFWQGRTVPLFPARSFMMCKVATLYFNIQLNKITHDRIPID